MSSNKKLVRERFRDAVFKRDSNRCRVCQWRHPKELNEGLDAHHITDRNLMPNGGYVPQNGISLCPECHEKAERFHSTGTSVPGYSPEELYLLIKSDVTTAKLASERLK